jgi:UDP-glucose 4-epimerase
MTRFLLSLDQAVDTIFAAVRDANRGETYIPRVPSARVLDIAHVLIGDRPIDVQITGIRPGEKIHEILVSEEEAHRTIARDGHFVILPVLPELRVQGMDGPTLRAEYSSATDPMDRTALAAVLQRNRLQVADYAPAREHALA